MISDCHSQDKVTDQNKRCACLYPVFMGTDMIGQVLTLTGSDLRTVIETVVAETKKGESVETISGKCEIDRSLVEQVVRLYLTHPEFAAAFAEAVAAGVQILMLPCHVEPDRLTVNPGYSLSAALKK